MNNMIIFKVAEHKNQFLGLTFLRVALIIVFIWFGGMKFTEYEALGIEPFITNSPLVKWLNFIFGVQGSSYALGFIELSTGLALIIGAVNAKFSVLSAAMSSMTFLCTLTFMFTTPGVIEASAGGFPAISAFPGQFLLKDIVLLAASLCLLVNSVEIKGNASN